ncbi:Arl1p ARF like GTpase involved in vesicular transport [Cryptosporidium sp. chipmunk genotype I]|uniref:Arl1p ARF like GTpase involved in vesicular transport n=1 Tax=Cryptosporidium sp. chipmunk genotype I TaxID=1280935 RepID=UPI00351A1A03|nr:Arl1p ARF like GTpase involved in vesicular transport [Cryptosporidium sp. chipmunk genotype I]
MKSLFSFGFLGKCDSRCFNILLTGPASSGRTAFLLRHLKGRYVDPATTDNINSAVIKRENCVLNIVDKDIFFQSNQSYNCTSKTNGESEIDRNGCIANKKGENKMQSISKSTINNEHSNNIDGTLFFIDSSDHGRIPLARRLLLQLVKKASKKSPILIVATKQDVLGALAPGELAAKLNIEDMVSIFEEQVWDYGIIGVSSYTGLGCNEALDWISEAIWQRQLLCNCIPFNRFCYSLCNSSIVMLDF